MVDEAALIAGFYEAAFDAGRFPDALRRLSEFADGIGSAMLLWDRHMAAPALLANAGHMGADASEAYRRHYAQIDPYRPLVEALAPGRWTRCLDHFDDGFVARSAFFNEYLLPRGIRYIAGARIAADTQFNAFVGIHRRRADAPFSADDLQRFERVGRHLARAIEIYLEVTRTRLARSATAALPDHLATPVLLLDADARVLFASPAAEARLAREAALGIRQGRLTAVRGGDERHLSSLVGVAATSGIGGEMLIRRSDDQPPLGIVVTPAGSVTTLYNLAPTPAALVLLREHVQIPARSIDGLRRRFGLTNSEATLALGLLDGKRLSDIAEARRVSVETVRTQLRSLFRKTRTARQVDLMRVLLATPEPLD